MVKPTEKPKAKPAEVGDVNGAQKADNNAKKPPPAKPYAIYRGFS